MGVTEGGYGSLYSHRGRGAPRTTPTTTIPTEMAHRRHGHLPQGIQKLDSGNQSKKCRYNRLLLLVVIITLTLARLFMGMRLSQDCAERLPVLSYQVFITALQLLLLFYQ